MTDLRFSLKPARSPRVFGLPAHLCATADRPALGGPRTAPAEWLWAVYAAPSPVLRRQALGLPDVATLTAWRERATARGTFTGYLGVCSRAGY